MSDIGICEYCKYKDEAAEPCWTCCVEKGNFEIDMAEHDARIRIDAIEEVKSKMISFHTDKVFQYGADIIEAKADAFDELKDWLEKQSKK